MTRNGRYYDKFVMLTVKPKETLLYGNTVGSWEIV